MSAFDKQTWVLWLIKLARRWTVYGFVDDLLIDALNEQESWMKYSKGEKL